jgi:hypothetical protein
VSYPDGGPEPVKKRTPTWLKVIGVGCGGVIVLILVAIGLVAGNWSKFSPVYQKAKSTFSDMLTLQAVLQKKYGTEVRLTVKRESGVQGTILGIALADAPLMDSLKLDSAEGRQAALDIATTARDALPPTGRYDNYEVAFVREPVAGAVSVSGNTTFRFSAAQLPPAKAESPR